eukprot:1511389-Amphidinium_carterae.1
MMLLIKTTVMMIMRRKYHSKNNDENANKSYELNFKNSVMTTTMPTMAMSKPNAHLLVLQVHEEVVFLMAVSSRDGYALI